MFKLIKKFKNNAKKDKKIAPIRINSKIFLILNLNKTLFSA